MSQMTSEELAALRNDQRRFRWVLSAAAFISLMAIATIISLGYFHSPPAEPLISKATDAIAGQVLLALFTALLGTSLVGLILDTYQKRFGERMQLYDSILRREGILATYRSSEDAELIQALDESLKDARSEIVGVGLGLSVLLNRTLLMRIAERLEADKTLTVDIILGSADNKGVMNRVAEEQEWHNLHGVAYNPKWVDHFPHEIRSVLELHARDENKKRVTVRSARSCPFVGIIKIDHRIFMFVYGAPSMRGGSESPWFELDGRASEGHFNTFAKRVLDHYKSEPTTEKATDQLALPPVAEDAKAASSG